MIGWHFAGYKLRDGRPLPQAGDTLTHDGVMEPCVSGLHASERAIDALGYALGAMVARIELRGEMLPHGNPPDKVVARERHYLTGYVDATRVLHEFACDCATQALERERVAGREPDPRSWRAVEVKRAWLDGKATDAELTAARAAAWVAAWDAARAAARDAQNTDLEARLTLLLSEVTP